MNGLESLRAAIRKAAEADDAVTMAQLLLAHAQGVKTTGPHELSEEDLQFCKSRALVRTVIVLTRKGEMHDAAAIARRIEDNEAKAMALRRIACRQAEIGGFSPALATVGEIGDRLIRSGTMVMIVVLLARAGRYEEALSTAHEIEIEKHRGSAINIVVSEQARRGEFVAALETVQRIDPKEMQVAALSSIAWEQLNSGMIEPALSTSALVRERLGEIEDETLLEGTLQKIAVLLARAGDYEAAIETARLFYHRNL